MKLTWAYYTLFHSVAYGCDYSRILFVVNSLIISGSSSIAFIIHRWSRFGVWYDAGSTPDCIYKCPQVRRQQLEGRYIGDNYIVSTVPHF